MSDGNALPEGEGVAEGDGCGGRGVKITRRIPSSDCFAASFSPWEKGARVPIGSQNS